MNRVSVLTTYFLALLVLAAMTGLVGCSNGGGSADSVTPDLTADSAPPQNPVGDGVTLGYYQLVFDDESVTVEEASPIRGAEFNVTPYATFIIDDFFFNEEQRNWYITATIKNISPFTGYDVWVVFHSMGNKFLVNQDGFLWVLPPIFPEPTRCPFICYGKDQPDRVFPPMYQDTRTIVIHQPKGIPKLAPIGFWIDATINPRTTPGVEDLEVESVDDTNYNLTGFVWDHQSPSEDLIVWADTSSFNGNNYEQMFDDGEHGDGEAGDDIFGANFEGNPEDGFYVLTVYAYDPQQNSGENDVGFWHGEQVPCDLPVEHWPYETIDKGEFSGIHHPETAVINGPDQWETVWQAHTSDIYPPPPPPPINFENHTVIGVWLGERPSNNHHVTIVDVQFDPCEDLMTVFYDYTPNIACGPLDVMTYPFHIIVLPKFDFPVYFIGNEVDCPPPPPECREIIEFEPFLHGAHSGIHEPYELRIRNMDHFEQLWDNHTANMWPKPPRPEINFQNFDLIAVGLGNRPSSGFSAEIFKICILTDQKLGVFYKERIPGPDCNVMHVITQPFDWVLVPKFEMDVRFFKHNEIYSCGQGDCEEPLMFWPIDEGQHTEHGPGEFVFRDIYEFHAFWNIHKPSVPAPQVNFAEDMVLAMLVGNRPTTGYSVETIEVCLNGFDDPDGQRIDVKYVENIPGENCITQPATTNPFQIIVVPKFDLPVNFHYDERVYDCPGPCEPLPFFEIVDGQHGCAEPGTYGFQGFNEYFEQTWYDVNCYDPASGDPPPGLPGIPEPEPGNEMKPFIIQLDGRPTSGYYITIDEVCLDECTAIIDFTLWEPGPDCNVDQVITRPWIMGVTEVPPIDCELLYEFRGQEKTYECGECESVPYNLLAEGDESCADPGEFGWQYADWYNQFWRAVHCLEPDDPTPPLPPDPEPINDGVIYHFGIQLPGRPTTGYYITVEDVCFEGCDVYIEWTENIPGENCDVEYVETRPWATFAVELPPVYCYWQWHFTKSEEVYECPEDPCYPFEQVAANNEWGGEEPGGYYIQTHVELYEHWMTHHVNEGPMPEVDFEGGHGAYCIHDGVRPTTGWEVEVFEVCLSDDPFGVAVRWIEWIPGETCTVEQRETAPWTMVTFPLVDLPYFDEGFEEIYQCD